MAIDNSNRVFFLRSEFKFGFWSGLTAPTQFFGPINFTKLEISTPKQSFTKLLSNMENSFGNLLDSQPSVTDPPMLSTEFDSMSGNMLALLLGADTSDLSQTTAAVADEVIAPTLGVWHKFVNRFITPDGTGTEIVFETATPTTIPNSNYEIDYINGMFRPLTSLGATAVIVSYHTATRSGEVYDAGLAKNKYVQLIGTATELATAKRVSLQLHKCSLAPSGTFDPVSNAYVKGTLEGDLLLPTGFVSPWRMEYLDMDAV